VSTAYDLQQTLYRTVADFVGAGATGGSTRTDRAGSDGSHEGAETREESADHDRYLERAIDRAIAAVTEEYERFRFHRAIAEIEAFARLLRRYRGYAPPNEYTYRRGLRTLSALVAPIAPFLAEETWNLLREDGLAATADWPEPLRPADDYRIERRVVRSTLDDVRAVTDAADIRAPERIELAVAPAWKYRRSSAG
jgi:leucyl-tRNA synthetase